MKKLNVSFIDNGKKEDAILKIKDDSFSITTKDNSIIKIPYSDIKDYEYIQDEKLIIKRKHSSDIVVEVSFDITLINTLKEIVKNSNVQSQPIYEKEEVNTKAENSTKPFKENVEQNTSNENQNNLNARPLNQTKASVNNSNKNSNIGGIVIAIVAVLLIGSFIFNIFFDEDDTDKKNDNSKIDEQTEKLDGMDGRWYSYDKYGLKEHDSYIVIDGKGNFYNVIGDYAFYKGSGIYIINDEKIIFYTDSNKSYEWHNCTLQTSDRMLCITSGSAINYQR